MYAEIANELLTPPKKLTPVNNDLKEENIYENFVQSPCHACEFKEAHLQQQRRRQKVKQEMRVTASRINKNELGLMGSFEGMAKLLEEFKFVKEGALTLKGRVAR